jgi:hypothetical protein
MDNETLNKWVEQYEKNKTLPSKKIACTVTGTEVTMFGPNLHKRVEKYGDIRTLLTTFVSRTAKKSQKQDNIEVTVKTRKRVNVEEVIADNQPATMSTEELMSVFDA